MLRLEKISYRTQLNEDEILRRIALIVEPKKAVQVANSLQKNHKPYTGKVNDDTFTIHRNIKYMGSFLPRIKGVVKSETENTVVYLKLGLNPIAAIAGVLAITWFAFIAFIKVNADQGAFELSHLAPTLVPLVLLMVMIFKFKREINASKKYLSKLFEANNNRVTNDS